MAAFSSIIAATGVAVGAAGAVTSFVGQQAAMEAQRKAETLRTKQMELEAQRKVREQVRQNQAARSAALATATAGGSSEGSILEGAYGGIGGKTGSNISGIQQNADFGRAMFQANAERDAGLQTASFGSAFSSLGQGIVNNANLINRVGTYFTSEKTYSY